MSNPRVTVLGHCTGRLVSGNRGIRPESKFDAEAVFTACRDQGTAVEINCQVDRLDLSDTHARLARERGARLVISTDAHSVTALGNQRWGVMVARRAWTTPADVLNACPLDVMRPLLRRNRKSLRGRAS